MILAETGSSNAEIITAAVGATVAYIALVYTVYLARKQDEKERKDAAGKVVAWVVNAAVEGDQTPSDGKRRRARQPHR